MQSQQGDLILEYALAFDCGDLEKLARLDKLAQTHPDLEAGIREMYTHFDPQEEWTQQLQRSRVGSQENQAESSQG